MWTYKDIHCLEVILELLRFPESVQYFLPRDCTLNQVRDPSVRVYSLIDPKGPGTQ